MAEQWDLEEVYDAEIAPLMAEIIAICKRVDMPMVATFHYANEEDGEALCTSALPLRPDDCETVKAANALIQRHGRPSPLTLTTRNAKGEITAVETILP